MPATAVLIIPWWGLIAAGAAAVAMILYARVWLGQPTAVAARRLEASVSSLGRALLPLLVPVLLLALLATAYYGPRAQVTVGVLVVAALWFLFHGESELRLQATQLPQEIRDSLAQPGGKPRVGMATRRKTVPLVVTLLAFAVVQLLTDGWSEWTEASGVPGGFVWLGVQLLVVAAALRLVGYATSHVRWLIVIVLALVGVRLGMVIGLEVLPSEEHFEARLLQPGPTLGFLFAVLVGLLAFEAKRLDGQPAPPPSLARKLVRVAGLGAAVLSALTITTATIISGFQTTDGAEPVARAKPVEGAKPEAQPRLKLADVPGGRNRRLAWTFAPVLRLHDDEEYPPTSARDYYKRAVGEDKRQLRCPDCADPAESTSEALHPEGVVFYARIATPKTDPEMFEAWTPGPVATLIQFWIFYDYNRWSAHTVLGRLVQEHDADWEFVAVALDADDRPLFLALSAHCGGQVVEWDENLVVVPDRAIERPIEGSTPSAGSVGKPSTHPIVAVALGSHGNYANDGGRRPPDWGSCRKLPTDALGPLTYASNVRDLTAGEADIRELVEPDDIEVVTRKSVPFGISAHWGMETISFGKRTSKPAKGPRSPPRQASWSRALELFFCDQDWRAYERAPRDRC